MKAWSSRKGPSLTPSYTQQRTALKVTALAAFVALAAALAGFLITRHHGVNSPRAAGGGTPRILIPKALPQARWQASAFPSGITGLASKKDLKAVKHQSPRAIRVVKRIFDVLLVAPSAAKPVIHRYFEGRAAQAFLRAKARLTDHLDRIQTTKRGLRVGIDAHSARKAIASVKILMKAKRGSQRVKLKQQSTLWLELIRGGWRVLAWRADQEPG